MVYSDTSMTAAMTVSGKLSIQTASEQTRNITTQNDGEQRHRHGDSDDDQQQARRPEQQPARVVGG
jgi:hypothetical protein